MDQSEDLFESVEFEFEVTSFSREPVSRSTHEFRLELIHRYAKDEGGAMWVKLAGDMTNKPFYLENEALGFSLMILPDGQRVGASFDSNGIHVDIRGQIRFRTLQKIEKVLALGRAFFTVEIKN